MTFRFFSSQTLRKEFSQKSRNFFGMRNPNPSNSSPMSASHAPGVSGVTSAKIPTTRRIMPIVIRMTRAIQTLQYTKVCAEVLVTLRRPAVPCFETHSLTLVLLSMTAAGRLEG